MTTANQLSSQSQYTAYIPCYENGNSVMAIKQDGQAIIINKSIKTLIKAFLKDSSLDMAALRRNFSAYTGRTSIIPIPLTLDMVLIPAKVRKTIGINDGSYGYINLSSISQVSGQSPAVITLKCGTKINCIEAAKTIKARIRMADMVNEKFASRLLGESNLKDGISAVSSEYSKPATKGDLCILAYEIIKIRNMLKSK